MKLSTFIVLCKTRKKFVLLVCACIFCTVFLASHFASLLFGINSLEVYKELKTKKQNMKVDIFILQHDNAKLQKEYFELKNLEPEQ